MYEKITPSFHLSQHRFDQLAERYAEAIKWLTDFTRVSGSSRLIRYRSILDKLNAIEGSREYFEFIAQPENLAAFLEAHDVIRGAWAAKFVAEKVGISKSKLAKLHQGTISYVEAGTSGDPSRETFFEFDIAGHLLSSGYEIELPDSGADVVFRTEGFNTFVECKRITSPGMVVPRVKEGLGQLGRRYTKGQMKEAGLVFASVDAVANPGMQIMVAESSNAANKALEQLIESQSDTVMEKVQPSLHKLERKTMGFYLIAKVPVLIKGAATVSMYSYTTYKHFVYSPGSPRYKHFIEFSQRISRRRELTF